jgi:methyl-accepting chemotaxis protein
MKVASISNLKIGKKIAAVLGGIVLLLTGLSGLSLWANHTTERLANDSLNRLTKSKLAEQIAADTAEVVKHVANMIIVKRVNSEDTNQIAEVRKARIAAMAQFKELANTPKSIQHAADMAELAKVMAAADDQIIGFLAAGRQADAIKGFQTAFTAGTEMYAKAKEASAWQEQLVAENEKKREETTSLIWMALIGGCLFALATAIFGGVVLTRGIATPLAAVVINLDQIAQGDLSKDASAEFQARTDEIGSLARAMQTMIVSLRKMVQEISGGISVLASSSTELMASSDAMMSGSRQASDKAHSVSAAAEEMSSNVTSVAAGMEQTTTNLAHVASATEQMTSTIGEIAQNSEKARRITDEATRQAARITEQINQLGVAAREIGKVTETITEISSQTNLLALNATIEAARAGSAGKGFAVVATEIKALAQQTAAATEDIKGRIAGVQAATAGGITEIGKVSQVITEVSAIVASIAAAIEEQATATKEIARNIAEASTGVNDANARVAETSHVSREIAKDIVSVDHAAGEMASGSDHVRTSAGELSTVAESLRVTVGRFHA